MAWRFYNDPNGLAVGFGVLPRMAPCKGRGPEESVDAEVDGEESEGAGEPGGAEGPEGAEAGRRGRGPEGAETVRSAESGRKWPKVAGEAEASRKEPRLLEDAARQAWFAGVGGHGCSREGRRHCSVSACGPGPGLR